MMKSPPRPLFRRHKLGKAQRDQITGLPDTKPRPGWSRALNVGTCRRGPGNTSDPSIVLPFRPVTSFGEGQQHEVVKLHR